MLVRVACATSVTTGITALGTVSSVTISVCLFLNHRNFNRVRKRAVSNRNCGLAKPLGKYNAVAVNRYRITVYRPFKELNGRLGNADNQYTGLPKLKLKLARARNLKRAYNGLHLWNISAFNALLGTGAKQRNCHHQHQKSRPNFLQH